MEYRTILVAVSGGSASAGAVELACRLAHRFSSHLEAFHVRVDARELAFLPADGFSVPLSGNVIELAMEDAAANADRAKSIVDAAAKRHALPLQAAPPPLGLGFALSRQPSLAWHEETGYAPARVAARARLFDLLVLGRSGRVSDEPFGDAVEEALLESGRPVLLAPAEAPKVIGDTIALAWNDSPESAHVLAAAMPLLLKAKTVRVLSVGDTGAPALAAHLAWYGIRAEAQDVYPVEGVGAGELVLAAARDANADLLVMGGYGHAPWREVLFGGATRAVIGTSLLPVLLSH
ncbi:MAG TPA: universal stress protein [Stellaceae bacterium]|nr:universal stress protein [Stellaceae bacterium]